MYKIEKFYLPGAIFIQNHSKMILSFDDDKKKFLFTKNQLNLNIN